MAAETVKFVKGDLEKNVARLVAYYGCQHESDVPISRIVIETHRNGTSEVEVGVGEYKTAWLLKYFSELFGGGINFRITNGMCMFIAEYFGDVIYRDALGNPETKHQTLRMLLSPGAAVILYLK